MHPSAICSSGRSRVMAATSSTTVSRMARRARACNASLAFWDSAGIGHAASFLSWHVRCGSNTITSFGKDFRTHPKAPKKRRMPSGFSMSPNCFTASRCSSVDLKPVRPTMSPRNLSSGWKTLPADLEAPKENPLAIQTSKNVSRASQCSRTWGSAFAKRVLLHFSSAV